MIHQKRYLEKKFGIINEYGQKLSEVVKSDGARGFNKMTGATKGNIVETSMATKVSLSTANATVYEAYLKDLLKRLTWQRNVEIQRQRALLKQFIADITNQIEWELAIFEGRRKLSKAELEYQKNQLELRGVVLLKLKAEAKLQLAELKKQQALLEKEVLPDLMEAIQAEMQAVGARKRVLEVMLQVLQKELQLLEVENQKTLREVDLNMKEAEVLQEQLKLIPKYREKVYASTELLIAARNHLQALRTQGVQLEQAELQAKLAEFAFYYRDKEIDIEERKARTEVSASESATQLERERGRIDVAGHRSSLSEKASELRSQINDIRMQIEYDKRLAERKVSIDSSISNSKTRVAATRSAEREKLDAVRDSVLEQAMKICESVFKIYFVRRRSVLEHIIYRGGGTLPSHTVQVTYPNFSFDVHPSGGGSGDKE